MGLSQSEIAVIVKAVIDDPSFQELKNKLGQVGQSGEDAAKHAAHGAKELEGAFGELKGKLEETAAEFLSIKAAGEFLWDSFKEAVQAEKLFAQLGASMNVLAGSTKSEVAETKEWLENAELQYGLVNNQLLPAFQQLVGATGDATQAQTLMKIAMDAHRATGEDLGEATQKLTQYLMQGKVRGFDPMAVAIRKAEEENKKLHKGHVNHAEVLDTVMKKMAEMSGQVDTTSEKLDQQKVRWERTKEAIGQFLLQLVDDLQPAMRALAVGIANVVAGWRDIGTVVGIATQGVVYAIDEMEALLHGNIAEARRIYQQGTDQLMKDLDREISKNHESVAAVEKAWDAKAKAVTLSAAATTKAVNELGGRIDNLGEKEKKGNKETVDAWKLREMAVTESIRDEIEQGRALAELYRQMAEDPKLNPMQQAEARLKALALDESTDKKELANAKKLADDKEKIALDEIKKTAKDEGELDRMMKTHYKIRSQDMTLSKEEREKAAAEVSAFERKENAKSLADDKKTDDEKKKLYDSMAGVIKKTDADMIAERIKQYKADMKVFEGDIEKKKVLEKGLATLEKDLAKAKLNTAAQTASALGGLAQTIFGDSKQGAIASAIINVIEGVTKAIAQGGIAGFATGAAVLAGGMMEVKKIQNTDYTAGKGFDDPSNDAIAELGGARWARDYTAKWAAGVNRGMAGEHGVGGGSTTNYHYESHQPGQIVRSTSVQVGAMPLIDSSKPAFMRELASDLKTYLNLDNERVIK